MCGGFGTYEGFGGGRGGLISRLRGGVGRFVAGNGRLAGLFTGSIRVSKVSGCTYVTSAALFLYSSLSFKDPWSRRRVD